jgi:hypothetical protein
VSRAKACRTLFLEQKLLRSRKGAETAASIFALRDAQSDEWRDVRNVEHQHTHAIAQLTDAQLHAIAAGSAGSGAGEVIEGVALSLVVPNLAKADQPGPDWMPLQQVVEQVLKSGYTQVNKVDAEDGQWEGEGIKNGQKMEFKAPIPRPA